MWRCGKILAAIAGLGGGLYVGSYSAVEALEKAPFPQMPYCIGLRCPNTAWDDNWDKLSPEEPGIIAATSEIEKNILLVRHGQYDSTGETEEERKLTKVGQEQMKQAAHRLASFNLPYSFVMGSKSTRGKESYGIIAERLGVTSGFNDSLNEGFPVAPVPSSPTIAGDDLYHRDIMRMEYAFRSLFRRPGLGATKNTYDVLVCPANIIRYFICRSLQFPPEGWLRFQIPHGSITWITIKKSGQVVVRCIGDIGFMTPNIVTF